MEVYTHRGRGFGQPENTEAAFRAAISAGVFNIETDIRKTKDGVLFLFHDKTLTRLTGREEIIANMTYEELEKVTVGDDQKIPKLEDIFKKFGATIKKFDLDIKEGVSGAEVLKLVEKYDLVDRVLFTSFYFQTIKEIKQLNPKATVGYLTEEKVPDEALRIAAETGVDYFCPNADDLTPDLVQSSRQHGLRILAWCPSNPENMQRAIDYGIDGLIVDEPLELLRELQPR